jgi:putative transposase
VAERKELVTKMLEHPGVSQRRACRVVGMSRSVWTYQPKRAADSEIATKLRELADQYPRWGFKKLYHALRHAGHVWNHKRVHRVYRVLKLHLRSNAASACPDGRPCLWRNPDTPTSAGRWIS